MDRGRRGLRVRSAALLLAAVVPLVAVALGEGRGGPSVGLGPASPQPDAARGAGALFSVGVLPFVSSAPIFIALDEGYFTSRGLRVKPRIFHAAQPVALAVASGDIEIGVTGLTAGFYNLAAKGALKIVAGQARIEPGYEFMAYVASPEGWSQGLRTLDDFPGRRVAVTQIGSTFHYMLGRLAEKRGFELDRVRLVPLESMSNVVAALRGGRVDGALLPAHLARPLAVRGSARILGWVSRETPWQVGAVFTSSRVLDRRGADVQAFLAAYREGAGRYAEALLNGKGEGEAQALAGRLQRWIPASIAEILAGAPYVDPGGRLDAADVQRQIAWYQERGLVDSRLRLETILAGALIETDGGEH